MTWTSTKNPGVHAMVAFGLLTFAGCTSRTGAPVVTTLAHDASPAAPGSIAAASPTPPSEPPAAPDPLALLAREHPDVTHLRSLTLWHDQVFAAVGDSAEVSVVVWSKSDAGSSDDLVMGVATQLAAMDLQANGTNDLVVWMKVAAVEGGRPAHHDVATLRAAPDHIGHGRRIAQLLRDTTGPDEARALIPHLRDYLPPADDVTATSMALRMDRATPAQLRALIAPQGVSICDTAEGNLRPHHHTCKTFRGDQLTDAVLSTVLDTTGVFLDWDDDPTPSSPRTELDQVTCDAPVHGRTHCQANTGGPAYARWIFQGQGASLRLVSVDSVGFEST